MKNLKKLEDFSKILDLEKEEISCLSDEEKNQLLGGEADTVATGYGMCICGPTECCKPIPFPF